MKKGFTLLELLLATVISSILVGLAAASYLAVQKIVGKSENDLIVAQEARSVVDRVSRDLRQATTFVSVLPEDASLAIDSLEFEDGHDIDPAGPTYIMYSLESTADGSNVIWRRRYYYFNQAAPDVRLPFNGGTVGEDGFTRQEVTEESVIIADKVNSLGFYGVIGLVRINIQLQIESGSPAYDFHSAVATRNNL